MSRFLIRLLGAAPPGGDLVPDVELLRRYAATRDPAAFELLVRRHANAVYAACVRVLRNDADADDAFQTTFLVLAKKATAIRGACAGAWLHRVAVNAALKLRARRTPTVREGVEPLPLSWRGARTESPPPLRPGFAQIRSHTPPTAARRAGSGYP